MAHARIFCALPVPARLASCHQRAARSRPFTLPCIPGCSPRTSTDQHFTTIRTVHINQHALTGQQKADSSRQHALHAWSIYDQPELYKRIFGFRDIAKEVKFLFDVYRKTRSSPHAGTTLHSFLEIGCGPAQHSLEALRQGAEEAIAVDNNPAMVDYARSMVQEAGTAGLTVYQGDAKDLQALFQQHGAESGEEAHGICDVALLPLGTLSHALISAEAVAWLRSALGALRQGGLLCIELAHPGDVFDGSLMEGDEWEMEDRDGSRLKVEYGSPLDDFDPITQVLQRRVAVSRAAGEGEDEWELLGEETVPQRVFTLPEVELLTQAAGMSSVVGLYGDYDLDVGLEDEEAYRLIVVLMKTGP